MMQPCDLQRITQDWAAGAVANDNRPLPDRYDDSEGLDEWMRDIRSRFIRGVLVTLYAASVAGGCVGMFWLGWRG